MPKHLKHLMIVKAVLHLNYREKTFWNRTADSPNGDKQGHAPTPNLYINAQGPTQ